MNDFNIKKFLTENKMTRNSQLLNETLNFVNSGELDTDLIKKTIKDNYESFESSMSMEEFNTYLDAYIEDAAHSVGEDEEAYNNISLSDLLDDFKTYVSNEDLNEESEPMEPTKGTGLESDEHTFKIKYKNTPVDIDAEETLILALLKNDDSAIQYLRNYIKDIQLV